MNRLEKDIEATPPNNQVVAQSVNGQRIGAHVASGAGASSHITSSFLNLTPMG